MAGLDPEYIVDMVIAQIEGNIPSLLEAIMEEHKDDIELEDIAKYCITDLGTVPKLPVMFVLCTSAEILAEMPSYTQAAYNLTLAVMVKDPNEERLKRKLYRYMQALQACIKVFPSLGWNLTVRGIEYSALYPEQQYISDARLLCRMVVHETVLA